MGKNRVAGDIKDPRFLASRLIRDVLERSAFANELLNDLLPPFTLPKRRFITELVYGSLRNLKHLDFWICKAFKKPIEQMDKELLSLIRVSLYQIIFMSNREAATIVYEAAEFAKNYRNEKCAAFVNFMLRETLRLNPTKENMLKDFKNDEEGFLQTYYSIPNWFFKRIKLFASEGGVEKQLKALNRPLGITLRVEGDEKLREETVKRLVSKGAQASPAKDCKYGIYAGKALNFDMLQEFNSLFVQDESSQLAVCEMDLQKGDKVLDLCAAPGGKSLFASYLVGESGLVTAVDINGNRLNLLKNMAIRHKKGNIETKLRDAALYEPEWVEKYDKVLVDAPCSALGTVRRRPEIKWIKNDNDPAKMASLADKILQRACRYVKKGGVLLFSVCTFTKEETTGQIHKFHLRRPEFKIEKAYYTAKEGNENRDLFFICKMRKTK